MMSSLSTHHSHWWLYVLKLEDDKWYVGISTNVEKRYKQHKTGFAGASWTKIYKPIEIYDTQDLGECDAERAQLFEGRVTRKYMEKYGDNNVRGGDLTDVSEYTRRFGRFWLKEDWEVVTTITFLLLVNVLFVLDKYVW